MQDTRSPIPWLHQFEVNTGSKQFVFERYNNVFVCDFSPAAVERLYAFISTVDENERLFPAAEVKSAKGVRELMRRHGLTSSSEMIRMLKSGAILNCPYTVQDVLRAHKIYGPDIAALKRKTKRSKPSRTVVDNLFWRPLRAVQTLMVDLFTVCGTWFFMSLSKPLDMLMVTHLPEGKKAGGLLKALLSHILSLS